MVIGTIKIAQAPWGEAERLAWEPTERMRPSEWAERYRHLSRRQSPRSGRWRNDAAPYLTGLMDLMAMEGIEEINIKKAAQMGVSEAARNFIGWAAHQEPDPMMLVLPNRVKGEQIVGNRILPLFEDTPVLAALKTPAKRDMKKIQVLLANGFQFTLGWSGSATSLASDPIRRLINDEVDKFSKWVGDEADPLSLGVIRTTAYEDQRMIVNISTPTLHTGLITQKHKASAIHLEYRCPCPHCGKYQVLTFDFLRWDKKKCKAKDVRTQAAVILQKELAYYECRYCAKKITEADKADMVQKGKWVSPNQRITKAGNIKGEWPPGKSVGVHLNALVCLWISWHQIMSEFIAVDHDPMLLMTFRNNRLGEVYEQQISRTRASVFSDKCRPHHPPAEKLPWWTGYVLATADTQHDHFYYVIRAWGPGGISRRIDHGIVSTFDDLKFWTLQQAWKFENGKWPAEPARMLLIDSGGTAVDPDHSRTEEVYRFALTAPTLIKPIKGMSKSTGLLVTQSHITYTTGPTRQANLRILLHMVDSASFKDFLEAKIRQTTEIQNPLKNKSEKCDIWQLNNKNDEDYNRQLSNEHKVLFKSGSGPPIEVWQTLTSGAANHYRDCEVYQLAAAHMAGVINLPPAEEIVAYRNQLAKQPKSQRRQGRGGGMRTPDGRPFFATNR